MGMFNLFTVYLQEDTRPVFSEHRSNQTVPHPSSAPKVQLYILVLSLP